MSHVSQVSNVSQEWDKWATGDPRMSQGRAKSEPSEPKWAKVRQEWAKSVKSAKSAEWAKSEPWVKWAMSKPRMSKMSHASQVSPEWAKSVPRVSQVSQHGRPEYSAFRCLLFGADLTDVGILR